MTQGKDTEVLANLQTTLLDEHHFLSGLVQGCLQELIKSEFDRYINAQPHQRSADRRGIRNGSYTRSFRFQIVQNHQPGGTAQPSGLVVIGLAKGFIQN